MSAASSSINPTDVVVQAYPPAVTVYALPTMAENGGFIAFLQLIPGIAWWLVTFITITLPSWIFTLFQTSLTVTMNATTV